MEWAHVFIKLAYHLYSVERGLSPFRGHAAAAAAALLLIERKSINESHVMEHVDLLNVLLLPLLINRRINGVAVTQKAKVNCNVPATYLLACCLQSAVDCGIIRGTTSCVAFCSPSVQSETSIADRDRECCCFSRFQLNDGRTRVNMRAVWLFINLAQNR